MRNSIRYEYHIPFSLRTRRRTRKQRSRKGRRRVEGRRSALSRGGNGRMGRKHVQNHYQPRRDRVALMEATLLLLEIYPLFFRRCIFHLHTPATWTRERAATYPPPPPPPPRGPSSSKHETHHPRLRYTSVTPLLQSCWLQRACFISRSLQPSVSNFFVFRCRSGMR